ncbi:MAG: ornithine cyclodeaminase family protein [Deltaproteobacteria bacterium]|nr:ornithine cyclodeaminase family protein [Deltaproteobacteria bacterium]
MADCIAALEAAYREEGQGTGANRTKSQLHVHTADHQKWYRFSSAEGGLADAGVVAIRIKSDVLSWPTMYGKFRAYNYCVGPDRFCGLVLLFRCDNGEPLAILNDGVIQHLRVGATAAIAAKYMAREDASVLGILGSGGMAESHLQAYATVRPLRLVKIYSPNRDHRDDLAARMRREFRFEIVAVDRPRLAVEESDIVATCTDSGEAVLFGEWLDRGMHVTTVNHREADKKVYARIQRYVSYQSGHAMNLFTTSTRRPRTLGGAGPDYDRLVDSSPDTRRFRFTDMILGKAPGRASEAEINLFKSEGTGVQFAALGSLAHRRCLDSGLGQALPLEWFTQKIRN